MLQVRFHPTIFIETKDGNYEDLEGHFNELEKCIEKLSKESKKYTSALSGSNIGTVNS